ncbi:tyrosine-type recombinase/integrase [Yinghuangia sp. YIM S10712]|uniref:tyrosine-type recombinase/integrase n=1 Tax=Yinghuangia sp. YIM S10712 TaxID=3436930 RepID=UPI003F5397EE
MADVYDRWHKSRPGDDDPPCGQHSSRTRKLVATADHGKGKRWQVRYRDADGAQRKENYETQAAAEVAAAKVKTQLAEGTYRDPNAGKVTVASRAREYLAGLTDDPSTIAIWTGHVEAHIVPELGTREMRAVRPSTVQTFIKQLEAKGLGPSTIGDVLSTLSAIFNVAVEDGDVQKNPCKSQSVKPPKATSAKAEPWPLARVHAVTDALPERYRILSVAAFGCGLRQGEAFALGIDDVDFLRHTVHVRRQIKIVKGSLVFAPPKGGKERDVPLPDEVANRISSQLQKLPAVEVTLPWRVPDGKPVTARLITTNPDGSALIRSTFNHVWMSALVVAGVIPKPRRSRTPEERERAGVGRSSDNRKYGMHALRHTYASVLLDAGESIRALADYLGHSDPAFTLRTYAHMMPTSQNRTRKAVDRAFSYTADDQDHSASALTVPS